MSWQNHKDTIATNIVQQLTSIPIFLAVPNLLSVDGYGQIVFVGTLLSFMPFADLGLSFVYSRKMPAIYASGNDQEVQLWNETVFTFRLYTSLLFGLVLGAIYLFKYQAILNSMLLFFFPPLTVITSFYIAQKIVLADFVIYRKISSFQCAVRLVTIPGVMFLGLLGWFFSQVLANLLTVFMMPRKSWWPDELRINTAILKENLFEGALLGATATLWIQLLASGRIFASFLYPDAVVAQYGLMNTGYQIVGSLIVSAFLPQAVKVYKIAEGSVGEAIEYTFKTILYATPITFLLTIISREAAPYVLGRFFPKHHIDPIILNALILSLLFYPLIVTLGSLLIAKKKSLPYLLLIIFSILLNWLVIILAEPHYGYGAAAIAQLVTLAVYSTLLLALIYYFFWGSIEKKLGELIKIYGSLIGLSASYFFIKNLLF